MMKPSIRAIFSVMFRIPYLRKNAIFGIIPLTVLGVSLVVGFGKPACGWPILGLAFAVTLCLEKRPRLHFMTLIAALAILGVTPVTGRPTPHTAPLMAAGVIGAALMPYVVIKRWKHDNVLKYTLHHGRRWYKSEVLYIVFTAVLAYLVLPVYFRATGSYENWSSVSGVVNISWFFASLMVVGVWDELFFVATVLGIFRRYLPFWVANLLQGVIFSSFLYELGFRGWGVYATYSFAIIQGYIFKRTESLFYAITVHLTFDAVLFFALLHAHHPNWPSIFLS